MSGGAASAGFGTGGIRGHSRTVDLRHGKTDDKRAEILAYFHDTWALCESLFECLADDDAYLVRPNPLRHPLIFSYGHTAVFFIHKLRVAGIVDAPVDPRLESLLAVGVDEMSWDDLRDARDDWPAPADVRAYRAEVRNVVDSVIRACAVTIPIDWDDPLWIVMMGIEHERIHLETASVLIRELPLERVRPQFHMGPNLPDAGCSPCECAAADGRRPGHSRQVTQRSVLRLGQPIRRSGRRGRIVQREEPRPFLAGRPGC